MVTPSPTLTQDADPEASRRPPARLHPQQIGPYRIAGVLGEGGMGCVYLAEQTEPVRREVALKLVHASLTSPAALARFAGERQALARLAHPNIAQMYEAGTTDEGFPYFVMERVPGVPITRYCDEQRLSIERRLELFLAICAGVQHAHQKGILHRDLKPSNLLVSEVEGRPVPKIIDFGIAKATDQPLTDATQLTGNRLLGTPAYMSPEAFAAPEGGGDLDTRADVYALGVTLYELLAGRKPLELEGRSLTQVATDVARTEPPPPSARFAGLDEAARARAAAERGLEPAALRRRLTGDLDWIVMKAIAKERQERYGSAADLAAELERHLRHEPVAAGPPSRRYRTAKFVRRHRLAVAAAALVVASLLLGVTGTTIATVRARRAEAAARREAEVAGRVSDFLVRLFEVSDPGQARGSTVTARELLDRGAAEVERELAAEPLVRSQLMLTMGEVYTHLGLYDEAAPLLERAVALRAAHTEADPLAVADGLEQLGTLYGRQGRYDESRSAHARALAIRESALGPEHLAVAESLHGIALSYWSRGDYETFEKLARRSLAIREKRLGPDHPDLAPDLNSLATSFSDRGRLEEALAIHRRVQAIRERHLGRDHPDLAVTFQNMANVYRDLGRPGPAEELYRRSLAIKEKTLGPEHPSFALTLNNLGALYFHQGRLAEAVPLLERAAAVREKALGPDHRHTGSSYGYLGLVAWKQGRHAEAEALLSRARAIFARVLTPEHENQATPLWGLACLYRDQGRYAEAEPLFRRALAIRERTHRPGNPQLREARVEYAALLRATGRAAEAAALEARAEQP